MKLLRDLVLTEKKDDLSRLPKDVMTAIKSNIRKGAEDLEQKWANALELVHKAYEIEGVQRPDPSMETAWTQYEENLQYAVQQLADNRGMDDDWRMSSSMFREARNLKQFELNVDGDTKIVEAVKVDDLIKSLEEQSPYDVDVKKTAPGEFTLRFSRFGIRKNTLVTISHLG